MGLKIFGLPKFRRVFFADLSASTAGFSMCRSFRYMRDLLHYLHVYVFASTVRPVLLLCCREFSFGK